MFLYGIGLGFLFNTVPWTSIFLLTQFFGVRLHVLQEREICAQLQRKLEYFTHTVSEKGCGYFCGWGFFGYISPTMNPGEAWLVSTDSAFRKLTSYERVIVKEEFVDTQNVSVYEKSGSFMNVWFRKRTLNLNLEPRENQCKIIASIKREYEMKNHCVAMIHGEPGAGKSYIGLLLATELKSSYCNSLRPWQPGESLNILWSEIEPTKSKPLVLVFDEFDGPLELIHNRIPCHNKVPIAVQDKQGWNRMLDDFSRGMFPHVILLLTTNKSPDYFSQLDKSYIRPGRVDSIFQLNGERAKRSHSKQI